MSLYAFIPLMSALLSLSSGIYVLIKARKVKGSRLYFLTSLPITGYCLFYFGLYQFGGDARFLPVWANWFAPGAFFVVPVLFHFLLFVLKAGKGFFRALFYCSCLFAVVGTVLFWSENTAAKLINYGRGYAFSILELSYFLFLLNTTLFLFVGVIVTIYQKNQLALSVPEQRRMNFIVISIGCAKLAVILNFLPGYGISVYHLGPPLLVLAFIFMSYALIGYRFLELGLILNRAVLAIFFVGPLFITHITAAWFFLPLLGYGLSATFSFIIVILILLFTPYRNFIQGLVDKAVYRGRYDYQRILQELSQTLIAMLDLEQLLGYVVQIIIQTIESEKVAIFLEDEEEQCFLVKASYGIDKETETRLILSREDRIVRRLKEEGKILVKEELSHFENKKDIGELFRQLLPVDAELITPLFFKERLVGIIVLSRKKSGHMYNQGDIDVLNAFAAEASVAIENARLYSEAVVDGLTRVFHHNYFYMRLKEEITRSKRYGHPLALVMLDIDHFKLFNDTYGHQAGDLILKHIGKTLRLKIRNIDIPARYGGEEFAVILPEIGHGNPGNPAEMIRQHINDAMLVAERLRSAVEQINIEYEGKKLNVTISAGAAYFDGVNEQFTAEELVKRADTALYRAKNAGRNKVVFYAEQNE